MLIATDGEVYAWERPGAAGDAPVAVARELNARAVAENGAGRVVAADRGGRWHRDGRTIRFEVEHAVACVLILPEGRRLLIGTEEAHLYECDAESGASRRLDAFDALPCRSHWHTPWGGPPAVRSLAVSPDGRTVYADIHVGSVMRSEDAGRTWAPVAPMLDDDVHQVVTCAAAPECVYANTADAVFVSDDRGRSWAHRDHGLLARYGRAIAVHPADPDCLLASVSDGPHAGRGRLGRSDDAGKHWSHVVDGFPHPTEGNIDTFQIAYGPDGAAWAAADRTLYRSSDRGRSWAPAWKAPRRIRCIACRQ